MNFLKISGLVIGTASVVGGTGAGIYYATNNKKSETEENTKKNIVQENPKTQFEGKLVFEKKSGSSDSYEIKFLNNNEYTTKETEFNKDKSDENEKYVGVNKVIEISFPLNISESTRQLNSILGETLTLEGIKAKIKAQANELKALFNDDIYTKLKTKFEVS